MSYPRDLDEIHEEELQAELRRRETDRLAGLCDYCHKPSSHPPCRFPDRHGHSSMWSGKVSPEVARLGRWLKHRPNVLTQVLRWLKTPVLKCEGHRGPCEGLVLWPTSAMTQYEWDGTGEDPNRDQMLCPVCAETYREDWQDRWDEYNAGRM